MKMSQYEVAPCDVELVELFRAGDDYAFELLARRHMGRLNAAVCAALYRCTGRVDAERRDRIAQDALVKAALNIALCRSAEKFGKWLARIAANAVIDDCRAILRAKEVAGSQLADLESGLGAYEQCPDPRYPAGGLLELMSRAEEAARWAPLVHRLMSALPAKKRTIAEMSLRDGLSNQEIARMTGLNEHTVSSHLAQARTALRKIFGGFNNDEMQRRTKGNARRAYRPALHGSCGAPSHLPHLQRLPLGSPKARRDY
jgi:RNA polymerase sigma factor (sigma-70 family)